MEMRDPAALTPTREKSESCVKKEKKKRITIFKYEIVSNHYVTLTHFGVMT